MKSITAFLCDFCPKRRPFKVKSSCVRHEKNCYRNPQTRSCKTCGNFEMVTDYRDYLQGGEHVQVDFQSPSCKLEILEMSDEPERLRTKCEKWIPKEQTEKATA